MTIFRQQNNKTFYKLCSVMIFIAIILTGTRLYAGAKTFEDASFSNGLKKWDLCWDNSMIKSGFKHNIAKDKLILDIPLVKGVRSGKILLNHRIDLIAGKQYNLSFNVKASGSGIIKCFYRGQPWASLGLTKILNVKPGNNSYSVVFKAGQTSKKNNGNITITLANLPGNVVISDIKLEKLSFIAPSLGKLWQVFPGVKEPEYNSKIFAAIPVSMESLDNKNIKPITVKLHNDRIDIRAMANGKFKVRKTAVIYNRFKSPRAGIMRIGFSADWWMEIYINGQMTYSTMKSGNMAHMSPKSHTVDIPVKAGSNLLAIKVLSGSKGWGFVCGKAAPVISFKENSEWKRIDKKSVIIKSGSALDLSVLADKPAGKYGRAIVGSGGFLAFAKRPTVPIRFMGFNRVWMLPKFSDKEFRINAVKFAKATSRQGYNIVRFTELGGILCVGSKADMEINPKMLDRIDFLMAELKKEGVYSHLIFLAYGIFSKNGGKEIFDRRNASKLMMYLGGKTERERFRYGIQTLFKHVNPYNGTSWKDDPSIAIVEFYNEQELGIKHIFEDIPTAFPKTFSVLKQEWRKWLKNKFSKQANVALLKELKGKSLDQAPVPIRAKNMPVLSNAFGLFLMAISKDTALWYEKVVREAGYSGITVQYNWSKKIGDSLVKWEIMRAVDMHTYFRHPTGFSFQSAMEQDSSIANTADYWRECNATRIAGRPFFVSEYNHPFWNPYQYEGGLVFSAYSALQGFDALMIHANAVMLNAELHMLSAFAVGNNPVARANEFLSACLFARGDVKKSPHSVQLAIPKNFTESECNSEKAVSPQETMISLLSGFSISFPWSKIPTGLPKIAKPDMMLFPSGAASLDSQEWFCNVIIDPKSKFSMNKIVAEMKKKGILKKTNLTDPNKGIYQSDTGEITMKSKDKLLKVSTPRSEAVSILANKSEEIGNLKLIYSSVPACVATCSVDDKNLNTSSRIVLIYSTVVANDGMELSWDRRVGRKSGSSNVMLMRTGKLQLTLKNSNVPKMALYALALDGSRREKLPLKYSNGVLEIKLDTAKLKHGPTPFFELVASTTK